MQFREHVGGYFVSFIDNGIECLSFSIYILNNYVC